MIDSIGSGESSQSNQANDSAIQQTLGQEEFLKILLTQLSFQDPLKPLDNQEFIAQMAQFTNLEQTRQLSDNSDILLTVQSATQAIGLIGKTATIVNPSTGATESGTVTTVGFSQGSPILTVLPEGSDPISNVRLANVISIRNE